jgi:GNAT superfamily N-acetyltransferase
LGAFAAAFASAGSASSFATAASTAAFCRSATRRSEHDDHHLGRAADLAEILRPGLTFTVVPFAREWQDRVTAFVLGIQNDEFSLGLTVADQPQLGAIESAFAGSGGAFWLALSPGGELVGTAGLERLSAEDGVVRKMFVPAGWRGRKPGVARRLMDEVLACARRLGLRRLLLDTPLHALAARRLYESHGFRERSAAGLPPGCHFVVKASCIYELLLR